MKLAGLVLISLILFLGFLSPVYAHPGRTAGDGCHYCRTNCDSWGEVWDARHCHGGGSISQPTSTPVPVVIYPTSTPIPIVIPAIKNTSIPTRIPTAISVPTHTPTPTQKPTSTPTSTSTSTPILTVKPTATPEVKGESTSSTEPPIQEESETDGANPTGVLMGIGALGAGGYWLLRKLQNKGKKE